MAAMAASQPTMSPPLSNLTNNNNNNNKHPPLPPLSTSKSVTRRTPAQRPTSSALLNRRVSSYSSTSRSVPPYSRPVSTVFPAFHTSLPYTLVRDFAYPWNHPMHYGPQPEEPVATPASERRLSDPEVGSWEDSRSQWSATPPWISDNTWSSSKDQLPARAFNDGGPPYSEDEDLRSPIVTTARHRKKSERGRSPGAAGASRGVIFGTDGDSIEEYHPTDGDELDGPGGEIETYTRRPRHRDSNFAKPLQRDQSPYDDDDDDDQDDDDQASEEYDSEQEARYSKDYSFSIGSPDEEMHGKAVALFDFASEHKNELPLREGQIILVSYRHGQGWLVAEDPVTGESGLVPEEFVRLARHIEGGLHGLNAVGLEDGENTSPTSADPGSATTPTAPTDAFEHKPAIQSNFSTRTEDFNLTPKAARVDKDEHDR